MLFQCLGRVQVVLDQQPRAQLFGVDERLFVVAVRVDAHFNADAVHVAAVLLHAVACVIGSLIIRQMVVDLVIVHRVVPRNNALLGVGVLVDERVVRGRICAGAGVVGLVDDEIPDLALLSRTGACALGKKVGHHRNILNVGQTGVGLRLAEHDLLCQHARRKRHDHQSDRQHQADSKSLAFLFACHDSPCLFRITSSCFFHCTTFYAIFQNKDCKLSMYKGNIIQSGLWRYQCIKFARKSRLSNYMMLPGKISAQHL